MRALSRVAACLVLAAASACAPSDPIAETARNLSKINSGHLTFQLEVRQRTTSELKSSFLIEGPFSFSDKTADVRYVKQVGEQRSEGRLTVDARGAKITAGSVTRQLQPSETYALFGSGQSRMAELPVGRWMIDPSVSDGGSVNGAATDLISAKLDVVDAVDDLIDLTSPQPRNLSRVDAQRLREAARDATIKAWTGKQDRLLRKLEMRSRFELEVPQVLRQAIGDLIDTELILTMSIENPND